MASVRRIISAAPASFLPLPERQIFRDCATASVEVAGDIIYLLSPGRILLRNESTLLAELQAMEQDRLCKIEA